MRRLATASASTMPASFRSSASPSGSGAAWGSFSQEASFADVSWAGLRLEERVERFLHRGAMPVDVAFERVPRSRVVHRLGDQRLVLGRARQGLRLLVVVVLQAMLEAAQEIVGRGERRARGLDEAALGERLQRAARRGRAQRRIAPAAHHLEELHRELDLADAARAHLDVVGLAAANGGLEDARVQLAQLLEHAVVEIAPVHEGLDALGHALGGPATTRAFSHA